MLFVVVLCSGASGDFLYDGLGRTLGVPTTEWYEVADWEISACMKWGGSKNTVTTGAGTMSSESSYVEIDRVISLQAERNIISPTVLGDTTGLESAEVIEVAWFIRPMKFDDDINYEVSLIKENGMKEVIASGNANFYNPGREYAAKSDETDFTKAELKFWNEDINKNLVVDIV